MRRWVEVIAWWTMYNPAIIQAFDVVLHIFGVPHNH